MTEDEIWGNGGSVVGHRTMIASGILTLGTSSSILKFEFPDQLQPAQRAVGDLPAQGAGLAGLARA
jgi:hypothetical protein